MNKLFGCVLRGELLQMAIGLKLKQSYGTRHWKAMASSRSIAYLLQTIEKRKRPPPLFKRKTGKDHD
jgi:hypothetical protein